MTVRRGKLIPIDVSSAWPNETAHFVPWLASPDGLVLLQDALGMDLVEAPEQFLSPFSADILAQRIDTPDEPWTLIEKLSQGCHVVGLITADHAEWAVVDRMRQMMEAPQGSYLATQTYALFTTTLCWILQHLRIREDQLQTAKDKAAARLLAELEQVHASAVPWLIPVASVRRMERVGNNRITVPESVGFEDHTLKRILINLRDASAHGDARNVVPFNSGPNLVGFTFNCSEPRNVDWAGGRITLLRLDMQRIGSTLATRYRDAIVEAGKEQYGLHFPGEDAHMTEEVA